MQDFGAGFFSGRVRHGFAANLIRVLALASLFLWPFFCSGATQLTLAHMMAPDHPRSKACLYFADLVRDLSQGRIRVEVYGDSKMGDAETMLKAVLNGSLDMTATTQGPVAAVVPEFNAVGMPFLFADSASAWRFLDGPVGQQLVQKAEAKGLIVLGLWENGIRHFSNSVRPLLKPSDFSGLKIRIPADPVTADIVEALGARAQQIRFAGVYDALRMNVADGQENPLVTMRVSKFYEVQKYLSLTAHKYETTPFLMGKTTWDALSEADRAVIMQAARQATRYQRELVVKEDEASYRWLIARGLRIDRIDPKPFIAATAKIYDKWYASPIGDYVRAVVRAVREAP